MPSLVGIKSTGEQGNPPCQQIHSFHIFVTTVWPTHGSHANIYLYYLLHLRKVNYIQIMLQCSNGLQHKRSPGGAIPEDTIF